MSKQRGQQARELRGHGRWARAFGLPAVAIVLVILCAAPASLCREQDHVPPVLGPNEKIASIFLPASGIASDPRPIVHRSSIKGLFYCQLDSSQTEIVVGFIASTKKGALGNLPDRAQVRVYRSQDNRLERIWESDPAPGTFLWPSGVWELFGDGRLQIVECSKGISSMGCRLGVYELLGQGCKKVFDTHDVQAADLSDLDGDGQREIIVRLHGGYVHVFKWNGKEFVAADRRFPGYFRHLVARDLMFQLRPRQLSYTDLNYRCHLLLDMSAAGMDMEVVRIATDLLERIGAEGLSEREAPSWLVDDITHILDESRRRLEIPQETVSTERESISIRKTPTKSDAATSREQ
jgi:hypothetical protein